MDAREVVSLLKLDNCPRRLGLAKQNVKPEAIKKFAGILPEEADSKFAMQRGVAFEDKIVGNQAKILRNQYVYDFGLDIEEKNIFYVPTSDISAEEAVAHTKKLFQENNQFEKQGALIFGAQVKLTLSQNQKLYLKPDFLVYRNGWRVGEIKAYSYEANLTNPHRIFSASAQACLYAIALQQTDINIELLVDLVFQQPRDLEAVEGEKQKYFVRPKIKTIGVQDVYGMFALLQRRLELTQPIDLEQTEKTPFKPCLSCLNSCPLWVKCQREMKDADKVWGHDPSLTLDPNMDTKDILQNKQMEFAQSLLDKQV